MDIGRTNKRIRFCRYIESTNELGQQEQTLKRIKTVWASVEPKSSREIQEDNKDRPELTYIITTRFLKNLSITPDMFIEFKGRQFNIIGPPRNIKENNVMLEFTCVEKTDEEKEILDNGEL